MMMIMMIMMATMVTIYDNNDTIFAMTNDMHRDWAMYYE